MKTRSNGKLRKTSCLYAKSKSTIIVKACKELIRDPVMRKQTVSFIKAVDGKKIRNSSGV